VRPLFSFRPSLQTDATERLSERLFTLDEYAAFKKVIANLPNSFRDTLTAHFNHTMRQVFVLGQSITVDEGPIPTYANNLSRTYSPDKPYRVLFSFSFARSSRSHNHVESCTIHRGWRFCNENGLVPDVGQRAARREVQAPGRDARFDATHPQRGSILR
jgi:hypothetical protein